MNIQAMYKGEMISKSTTRTDVNFVVVSMHKGQKVISGMYKDFAAAQKGLSGFCNPAWTENEIAEVAR